MKKLLILLALVCVGSLGLAQGNRSAVGLYVLGGQYTIDTGAVDVRFGVGLPLLFFGLLSGSFDLLFPMGLLGGSTRWYMGAGSEVYLALGGGAGGAVFTPRGFANLEFGGDGVSLFFEGGLQGVIAVGGGTGFRANFLFPHFRLGVNFR